ncbi:MAG: hypothetical protein WCW02_04350 [Candidatus Buchananbacteria bacterium]
MTNEHWQGIVGQILDSLKVQQHLKEALPEPQRGEQEVLEFIGPSGKMKLERITRPLVLDKKTLGSRRIGGSVTMVYKYSDQETTDEVNLYSWDEATGDWQKIKLQSFFNG